MRRVVITGMGVVSPAGNGTAAAWEAVRLGRSCYQASADRGFHKPLGTVDRGGGANAPFQPAREIDPTVKMALEASREAVAQADFAQLIDRNRMGVVIGSGAGNQQTHEMLARRMYGEGKTRFHPLAIPRGMFSSVTSAIATEHKARGVAFSVSSACASATHAIGQAMLCIGSGGADVMITGGSEACLTPGCLAAWDSLHVLAQEYCRPFSAGRDGLVLAEGAAILVLEDRQHALNRGAVILAEIAGYGACSDATALTAPDPSGMARSMRRAIDHAGIDPDQICAINAHGTATESNDRSECAAIIEVFGARHGRIPVSSTKSVLGHSLGASGAIELAMSVRSLQEQFVAPTANHLAPDKDCPVDCVPNQGRAARLATILSNSFAFGGLNASIVVRHAEAA